MEREREKEKNLLMFILSILLQNCFMGLDGGSGASSGAAQTSCQPWGKRKDKLGPAADTTEQPQDPQRLMKQNDLFKHFPFLLPLSGRVYCSLFCIRI